MGYRSVTVLVSANSTAFVQLSLTTLSPFVFRATFSICVAFALFVYIGILVKGEGGLAPGVRNHAKIACDHVT